MLSVDDAGDKDLKRPGPLITVMNTTDGLRIYSGHSYTVVSVK